ncbi:hypothetical protein L9F63_010189 [Diploptera punctata]|uniref:C2H2-type domain-containing protein n=1 Tax=Diploptera punctata TaxID=6984 RepID=A0AAD8ERQ7_DIPPU|nr:hypothetical protein L9F63_010189 [Diploptera punctata]
MKVKKQDIKIKNRSVSGKRVKHVSGGKVIRRVKDRLLMCNDDKQCQEREEKCGISHGKEVVMPSETRQDYHFVNGSAETPVLLSSEGILRQALLSFTCPIQEDKTMKETATKKNDKIATSQTIIKLTCSPAIPLSSENINIPASSKELTKPLKKTGTLLSASVPIESLPLVPIPPVSLTSGTFSHGALSLMSLSPGSLPPVSEIPRPGNISALNSSADFPSGLSSLGVVATVPTTFIGNSSNLSDVPNYEVSQFPPHSLKVLVSLSNVTATSIHMSGSSPVVTQSTASSKKGSVTLVYSSFPKMESTFLNYQKILPLPSMAEVKSQNVNVLHLLERGKDVSAAATSNDGHIEDDDSIPEVIPVNTEVLSANSRSPSIISVLDTSVSNESGSSSNPIKLDDTSSELSHANVDVSHAVSFESQSVCPPDLNQIIIPVTNTINSDKVNDNCLTTQQINQIITIPLTSNTVNGSTVPLAMPGALLPMSGQFVACPLIVNSYPGNLNSISTANQQQSRLGTDIPGMITVTSSMVPPVSSTITVTSVTSVSTSGISDSIPVTSVSTSVPSLGTTTVFATPVEPVTSYAMQSPAEILSQLSKAGVFPTMSSSQVSSVLSALASDSCHLDLEADNSHHVELLSQHQVMNLSSTVDKVSTLTQTEDLKVGDTLSCDINMQHSNDKEINIPEQIDLTGDDRLMEQHLDLLNDTNRPHIPLPDIPLPDKNLTTVPDDSIIVNQQINSNTNKEMPSIYPKLNSDKNIVSNLSRNDLTPKIDVRKQIIESMGISTGDQSLSSMYVNEEEFENGLNEKIIKTVCNITVTKKTNLQAGNDNAITNKKITKKSKGEAMNIEEISCYKCKFCPFLTLHRKGVEQHVQVVHRRLQNGAQQQEVRQPLNCPGCTNIFFSSKSLRMHLSQDHLMESEELKIILDLVLKFIKTNNKKKKKNVDKSDAKQVTGTVNDEVGDKVDNSGVDSQTVAVDERNKIRVKNLNSEALVELNEALPSIEVVQTNDPMDEENITGDEVREGTLVIDDDPLMQQKRKCEFQLASTDINKLTVPEEESSAAQLCDELESSIEPKKQKTEKGPSSPSTKKKRGRPKGSKNVPSENYENLSSSHSGVEKESGYRCDIDGCAVKFRSHDNIEYHRRCHRNDKFVCPECSQETIHWNSLSTHLWRYHVIDMELHACDICGYKTNSVSKLKNVHRRIHGDERPFLCDICGKGFKNPKQMRNHKTIHTSKQKHVVGECDVCGRTFTSLRMLRVHKDNVHGKLRPHLCNYCGYSASSRSTLKMHMRQHTGEKPFHCDECDYETADHNSLRRHKMRHSGDKPYKCPHCNYACIQSSTYKAHLNTKHPGLESGLMFSCHMCSFRSVRKDNYLAHVVEHEVGGNTNIRQRKHKTSKPQVESDKGNEKRESSAKVEKSRLPVIINIANLNNNAESSENVHLVYNSSSLLQPSEVKNGICVVQNVESVIHLVGELDANSETTAVQRESDNVQTLCVANIETVAQMPLTPEFEAEEITGDIQDIKEPQELKFKVYSEDLTS